MRYMIGIVNWWSRVAGVKEVRGGAKGGEWWAGVGEGKV